MIISGYLVVLGEKNRYSNQYKGSVRFCKNKPSLSNKEIALKVNLTVPDEFFERMMPVVNIDVPKEAAVYPQIETAIKLTSLAVGGALRLDCVAVEDALTQMIEERELDAVH